MTQCWQQACSVHVLWPWRLSLLDLARGLFRQAPPSGRECHQRLLVQPFCSEVTLSRENPSLTPTCMSPVLRSPSLAPRGQGNIGERQQWAHGTERSLPISQQVVASQLNPADSPLQPGLRQKQLFVTLKKIKSKKAYSMPRSSRTSTWKVVRYVGVGKEQTEITVA